MLIIYVQNLSNAETYTLLNANQIEFYNNHYNTVQSWVVIRRAKQIKK
jgi:hypothetical protein